MRRMVGMLATMAGLALTAPVVLAHGYAPEPANALELALAWSIEAHVLLPLLAAFVLYWRAVRQVAREHPANPVPRWREWSWYAGLLVLLIALQSPIATYDTTFFSVHMVQHLLMAMVAAPLLALAAPITLLLRVSSPATRQKVLLPLLHSRPMRIITFPVVTWILFAGVMWATHFSPLYDAALESEAIHLLEHALYMGVAILFWWPVVGADPSPWRMPHAARIGYLFLGMPQSSFLGLAILSAPAVLYEHYSTVERTWGPSPLADQQLAGGIMWAGGDLAFLLAMILAVWVWLRAEEEEGRRVDARLDREAAARARTAGGPPASARAAPPQQR
jgi:cytochrome c oxidase assembly factor CtaG